MAFSFISGKSFASKDPATVTLKNGQRLEVEITRTEFWGMWLSDGRGLSYRVISTLSTTSDSLTKTIGSHVENLAVTAEKDTCHIDFSQAVIQPVVDQHPGFFRTHSYSFGALSSRGENLAVELTRIPRSSDWLAMRFGLSMGWYSGALNHMTG